MKAGNSDLRLARGHAKLTPTRAMTCPEAVAALGCLATLQWAGAHGVSVTEAHAQQQLEEGIWLCCRLVAWIAGAGAAAAWGGQQVLCCSGIGRRCVFGGSTHWAQQQQQVTWISCAGHHSIFANDVTLSRCHNVVASPCTSATNQVCVRGDTT